MSRTDKGIGGLGTSIVRGLLRDTVADDLPILELLLFVRSNDSVRKLESLFADNSGLVRTITGINADDVSHCDVLILGCQPDDVKTLLNSPHLSEALVGKLLISIVAGWTKAQIENELYQEGCKCTVIRTLPNIAASISESITAVEISQPAPSDEHVALTDAIFKRSGTVAHVTTTQMDVSTALGGSTPAFFAIICDALIDAAHAMGLSRPVAEKMTFQAMRGSAGLLLAGDSTTSLKEKGTSPGGCTIGAIMGLEEAGLRGIMGRALREATSIAALLGQGAANVNGTRLGQLSRS